MNYQVCKPLTQDEYDGLKASIAATGVEVAVVVDEKGDIIDGHHRMRAYYELKAAGVDVPPPAKDVRLGLSEAEKRNLARTLNADRRHMSTDDRNSQIVAMREDGMSYRQIGKTVGVDPTTAMRIVEKSGVANATPGHITGADGKQYPATKSTPAAPVMRTFGTGMPALDLPGAPAPDPEWDAEVLAWETDMEERWDACAVCRHNISVKVDGEYRKICAATATNLDLYQEYDDTGYPPCYDEDADTLAHFQMPDTDDTVDWEDVKDELLADEPDRPKSLAAANHAISDDPDYDGDEWYTPLEFIAAARCVLGDIDLDPASSDEAQTVVQAARYATKEDDSLRPDYPWAGRVWMNPPYSMPLIRQFVNRIIDEYDAGNVTEAIVLTNNSSDTQWFHALLSRFPACFTRGRIYFWRKEPDNNFSTRQGQTLFYLGPNVDAFAREFAAIGLIVECTHAQPQD